tara:strand:- start:990 stop:1502 length:513 start_codon:yes stop_codon:yes gene_type:complete
MGSCNFKLAEKETNMVTRKYGVADIDKFVEQYRPFTIGFEKVFDNLNTVSEIANNYPPYNIIKQDDEHYIIEIAGAGFRSDEFNIHVVPQGNKLVVQGVQDRGEDKKEYLHKGIGARNFTRTFALTEDVRVLGADFDDGMLYISLEKVVPEEMKAKEIKVSKGQPQFLQE